MIEDIWNANIDELIGYARGRIIISIGNGDFNGQFNMLMRAAYSSGFKKGQRQERNRKRRMIKSRKGGR